MNKIIKAWIFNERARPDITVPTKGRLNTDRKSCTYLQLKNQGYNQNGKATYSTDTDIIFNSVKSHPHALYKWHNFEIGWDASDLEYAEYTLTLSGKAGNNFNFSGDNRTDPKIGDRVFQGNYETTISAFTATGLTLADGSNITNDRVYCLRSACDVGIQLVTGAGVTWWYNVGATQWEIAGATEFNTQFQINNNIATLNITTFGKEIGFNIKLSTTDILYTPLVYEIKVLGEFDISFMEDMLFDTIMRGFTNNLEVSTEIVVKLDTATATIDLGGAYQIENNGYNLLGTSIVAYNLTTDPNMTIDIANSYAVGAAKKNGYNEPGVFTLTASQSKDDNILMKINYIPEVAVNTNQDYYDVNHMPSIVFEKISKRSTTVGSGSLIGRDNIKDKLNGTGVKVGAPEELDLVIEYAVFTSNQSDQHRLGDALHSLFNRVKQFTSWGLGEPYPIMIKDDFQAINKSDSSNVQTCIGRFELKNVLFYFRQPDDKYLVDNLEKTITTNPSR